MDTQLIKDYSSRLKTIAKDLSFLGHPRFPIQDLLKLFPQHHIFIQELEDVSVPFPVQALAKKKEMDDFLEDLEKCELSPPMKMIFQGRISDYQRLLSMMENFNTPFFYDHAVKLYGTSHKLIQNNSFLYFLEQIPKFCVEDTETETLQGEEALSYLRTNLAETFEPTSFEVKPSTSLLSDSSAGRKTLKLNPYKAYTKKSLDVFLVHEGWVHLGTSLNGASQNTHLWLGSWAPRTTFLQEGLAVLTELITGCMTLERWNRVMLRHLATSMAERGSSITDVYSFLLHHEIAPLDAFKLSLRVFRGVPLEGGMAFTKELLYLHGMIELLYHLHFHKKNLKSLWLGKMSFEEHLMILDPKNKLNPTLNFFPLGLETSDVQARLHKLKELSFSIFNRGFL